MAAHMHAPKSRVRYVPTHAQARSALILAKVNGVDAYVIRLADGQKLTVSASQIHSKIER